MSFKIHPGIGIARVGDSVEFFIGPETLEIPPVPAGGYRDDAGKIRRQAARFRVFEYDDADPTAEPVEVTGNPAYAFEWTVTLRRRLLPNDSSSPLLSNPHTIAGVNQVSPHPTIPCPVPTGATYSFGELRTDPQGHLLVLSTTNFPSNGALAGAFDGLCDGTVAVVVTGPLASAVSATTAWVFVGPPDFAPGRQPAKSLYHELYQAYVDQAVFPTEISSSPLPSFRKDIFPILRARNNGRPLPTAVESGFPLLAGIAARQSAFDDTDLGIYSSLTSIQTGMFARWIGNTTFPDGEFLNDWPPSSSLELTPKELDRGAISHCLVCGTWEMSTASLFFGPGSPHVEPFRLASTSSLLLPTLNWIKDLPACSWAPQTEDPSPSASDSWTSRGFMILDGDDLTYVEHTSDSYLLLLTPALDFGEVQAGPGGSGGWKSLPITFEIRAGASSVSASIVTASLPPGLTATTVPPVPAGATRPIHLWVTYDTATVSSPLADAITVDVDGTLYDIPATGHTVPFQGTKLALALDCSYSMTESAGLGVTKMVALKQALLVLLEIAREGDAVAFASFSDDILDTQPLLVLGPAGDADSDGSPDDPNRQTLAEFVEALPVVNNTSIGDGLERASILLAGPTPGVPFANDALIVITDGKETAPQYIHEVADRITSTTFALGIGTATNVNFGTLQTLTGNRGGAILLTGNLSSGEGRYALEKCLIQILHGASNEEIILDPPGTIMPGAVHRIDIPITEAETSFKATVVSDEVGTLLMGLETPEGQVLSGPGLTSLPGVTVLHGARVSTIEVSLPLLPGAGQHSHMGRWRLRLESRLKFDHDFSQALPRSTRGKPVTYMAVVSARSAIRFRARLGQSEGLMLFEANASDFGAPPRGQAHIVAELKGPSGLQTEVVLKETEPGRYLAEFRPASLGDYHVRIRAHGRSRAGYPFYRELALVGASLGAEDKPFEGPREGSSPGGDSGGRPKPCRTSAIHETLASLLDHWAARLRKKC